MTDVEEALAFLFENEGQAFVNDPSDSGGPTKLGVTQRSYSEFIGYQASADDIRNLSQDQIHVFYRDQFWEPLGCPRILDTAMAIALFDTAVLYGVGIAAILAQKALAQCGIFGLKFDGIIGENTIAAFNATSRADFLPAYRTLIMKRIDSLILISPKNEKFRRGWENRADRLLTLMVYPPFNKEDT